MSFPSSPNQQTMPARRPSHTMQTFGFNHPTASPSHLPVASTSTSESTTPKRKKLTHAEALEQIRTFLRSQSSYDVFPVSFRLIVLDHHLVVKKALNTMLQNGEPRRHEMGIDGWKINVTARFRCRCRLCTALGLGEVAIRR